MECLIVGNSRDHFQYLAHLVGSRWESKSAHFVSTVPSSVDDINEFIADGDDDTEKVLILLRHSATELSGDRRFFDRVASESTEEFAYCNLRDVIDTHWRRSKIRTLYVWNFSCRSQNADVDCSLRNLNEQCDNESNSIFKRKGVQMRSLIHKGETYITNSLIFDVFRHLELGNILDDGDENEYSNVKHFY